MATLKQQIEQIFAKETTPPQVIYQWSAPGSEDSKGVVGSITDFFGLTEGKQIVRREEYRLANHSEKMEICKKIIQ